MSQLWRTADGGMHACSLCIQRRQASLLCYLSRAVATTAAKCGQLSCPCAMVWITVHCCLQVHGHKELTELDVGGPVQFIAVSDDAHDPALQLLPGIAAAQTPSAALQCCVAPPASSCSQKIRNLLTGIEVLAMRTLLSMTLPLPCADAPRLLRMLLL